MTGLLCGTMPESTLTETVARTPAKTDVETTVRSRGEYTLGVTYPESRDPAGWRVYDDDGVTGLLYGAVPALADGTRSPEAFFEGALENPAETLSAVDGPFVVACTDGERLVAATDHLATRPCHYSTDGGVVIGSNLSELATVLPEPTVDTAAVSDMVVLGQVWGEKTLLDEVRTLGPAELLVYEGGALRTGRYHAPTFDARPRASFTSKAVEAFQDSVGHATTTMSDASAGLWLSGGLDSRALAAELGGQLPELRTYTYDANPAGGGNLELAREVARTVGLHNEEVDLSPDTLVDHFADAVSITDGMLGWQTFLNLTATFELPNPPDLLLEACGQGVLMGGGIGRAPLELGSSPGDALYRAKHAVPAGETESLLAVDRDPTRTYREAVARADQEGHVATVLEAYYRNYLPRGDFASNKLVRARTGTRVPFASRQLVDVAATMPLDRRVGWVPGTRGKVPFGVARGKLDLVRELDSGLESIPYERTKRPPERPQWQHAVGFVVGTSVDRLLGETTYGGQRLQSVWSLSDERLRTKLVGLLEDAAERPFFDTGAVETLHEEHFGTETADRIGAISGVTTVEQWIQTVLEGR
jgi:asparagine synthase (glutamine-hydrolysing)